MFAVLSERGEAYRAEDIRGVGHEEEGPDMKRRGRA
jgi:hypothetical protein